MARGRPGKQAKNSVMNVRIQDPYAGDDASYVDRCIMQQQTSHEAMVAMCSSTFNISSATTAQTNYYSGLTVRNSDDFTSFNGQFETYRIRCIKFDVYDINPALVCSNIWSTFHDIITSVPAYTFDQVTDGADSQTIPPGIGKVTFYWRAKGAEENNFQSTDAASSSVPPVDYGGLRVAINPASSAASKFTVVVKAIVDFRGRF